jgi:hypothetical protein
VVSPSLIIVERLGMPGSGFTNLVIVERFGITLNGFTKSCYCGEVRDVSKWFHPVISLWRGFRFHKVISSNLIIVEKFFGSH